VSGFHRRQGELHCDEVHVGRIAREAGTPVHVYSAALLTERLRILDEAFAGCEHRLHYALKANSTLAIVRLVRELGAAADANSGGEIQVALRAGFEPGQVVFSGVGKTRAELEEAVALGLAAINVESAGEVERIDALARARGVRARIAVRVNPDIDPGSHPHISTGLQATKFGMAAADAARVARDAAARPSLHVVGLHAHIGSQIMSQEPLRRAARLLADMAAALRADGLALEHLDLGGGLGIAYRPGDKALTAEEYADAILPAVQDTGLTLALEPGRWLVGPAGILVTTVVDIKPRPLKPSEVRRRRQSGRSQFIVVDAGMTELLRPALYDAWHAIEPVSPREGPPIDADVVGPLCETSDTLGAGRRLPPVEVGDRLVIRDTGAYGAVMASNYNRRPMAAEVLVDATGWRRIRRRQTIDDMLRWDE
jgi:diaminopimelate decarboxylase